MLQNRAQTRWLIGIDSRPRCKKLAMKIEAARLVGRYVLIRTISFVDLDYCLSTVVRNYGDVFDGVKPP